MAAQSLRSRQSVLTLDVAATATEPPSSAGGGDAAALAKKLANPDFLAKAAEAVVKKEQEKARGLGEKQAALETALKRLAALAAGG